MQTEHLKVTGMTCGGCTKTVTHALEEIPGVSNVKVSLDTGVAAVLFDEHQTTSERLMSAVKNAGYGVEADSGAHMGKKGATKGGCCG